VPAAIALALGGQADVRLTGRLACAVSRSTLVRFIRVTADPVDQAALPPLRNRRGRRSAGSPTPAGPGRACPARTRPTCGSGGMRDSPHRAAAPGVARPQRSGQPAHPAPDHSAAPPEHRRHRRPRTPSARQAASWILTTPGDLAEDDLAALVQIIARREELKVSCALVRDFADMLCHRHGERLEAWACQAETSPAVSCTALSKGFRSKLCRRHCRAHRLLQLRRRRRPRQPSKMIK
jgi:hypothetical protein